MSQFIIFRRTACGNFESYVSQTNGWNYFQNNSPDVLHNTEIKINFSEYVSALRAKNEFIPGIPHSIGIRHYPITVCSETGRVEVAEGDAVIADINQYYIMECRKIFIPGKVRLWRRIRSHGRDECYTNFFNDEEADHD